MGTLIFSYINVGSGHLFGFKILNLIILGFFRKMNIFGYKDFVGIFGGSSQNWTLFVGHFYAFVKVQNGGYFWGCMKFLIFFWG